MRTLLLLLTLLVAATSAFLPTASAGPADARRQPPPAAHFVWPLAPPHPVVRPFQPPSTPYGPGHRGVDLASSPGAPVSAAGDGVVVYAGQLAGRGLVSISHANGLNTTYEPLTPAVTVGARVTRGTVVGHLVAGHLGCVDAPACLHWGARRGDEYLDPLGLLSSGRVRLLPWDGSRL